MIGFIVCFVLLSMSITIVTAACAPGFVGSDCSRNCADSCNGHLGCSIDVCNLLQCVCSGHGDIDLISGLCRCDDGFSGIMCDVAIGGAVCGFGQTTGISGHQVYATCNPTTSRVTCANGAMSIPTSVTNSNVPFSGCMPPLIGPVSLSFLGGTPPTLTQHRLSRGFQYDIVGSPIATFPVDSTYMWWFLEPSTTLPNVYIIHSAFDYGRTLEADARPTSNTGVLRVSLSTSTLLQPTQWQFNGNIDSVFTVSHLIQSAFSLWVNTTGSWKQTQGSNTMSTQFNLRFYDVVAPTFRPVGAYNWMAVVGNLTTTSMVACRSQCLRKQSLGLVCGGIAWAATGQCMLLNTPSGAYPDNSTTWDTSGLPTCAIPGVPYPTCNHKHVYGPVRLTVDAISGAPALAYDISSNSVQSVNWATSPFKQFWLVELEDNSNEVRLLLHDSYTTACLGTDVSGTVSIQTAVAGALYQRWFLSTSSGTGFASASQLRLLGVSIHPVTNPLLSLYIGGISAVVSVSPTLTSTFVGHWDMNNPRSADDGPTAYIDQAPVLTRIHQSMQVLSAMDEFECRSICRMNTSCSGYSYAPLPSSTCGIISSPLSQIPFTLTPLIGTRTVYRHLHRQFDYYEPLSNINTPTGASGCAHGSYKPTARTSATISVLQEDYCVPPQFGPVALTIIDTGYPSHITNPGDQSRIIMTGDGVTPVVREVFRSAVDREMLVFRQCGDVDNAYTIHSAFDLGRSLSVNASYVTPYSRSVYMSTTLVYSATRWALRRLGPGFLQTQGLVNGPNRASSGADTFKLESIDYPGWYLSVVSGPLGDGVLAVTEQSRPDYPGVNYGQAWSIVAPYQFTAGYLGTTFPATGFASGQSPSVLACKFWCQIESGCGGIQYSQLSTTCKLVVPSDAVSVTFTHDTDNYAWSNSLDLIMPSGCWLSETVNLLLTSDNNAYSSTAPTGCIRLPGGPSYLYSATEDVAHGSTGLGYLHAITTAGQTLLRDGSSPMVHGELDQVFSLVRIAGDVYQMYMCGEANIGDRAYESCFWSFDTQSVHITQDKTLLYLVAGDSPANFQVIGDISSSFSLKVLDAPGLYIGGLVVAPSTGNGAMTATAVTWQVTVPWINNAATNSIVLGSGFGNTFATDASRTTWSAYSCFAMYTSTWLDCYALCQRDYSCAGFQYSALTKACSGSKQVQSFPVSGIEGVYTRIWSRNTRLEAALLGPVFSLLFMNHGSSTPDVVVVSSATPFDAPNPNQMSIVLEPVLHKAYIPSNTNGPQADLVSTVVLWYCPGFRTGFPNNQNAQSCHLGGNNGATSTQQYVTVTNAFPPGMTGSALTSYTDFAQVATLFIVTHIGCDYPAFFRTLEHKMVYISLQVAPLRGDGTAHPQAGYFLCSTPASQWYFAAQDAFTLKPTTAADSVNCVFAIYDSLFPMTVCI